MLDFDPRSAPTSSLFNRLTLYRTGFGNHGDYVFGWKGDALQKAMDGNCNVNCPTLKSQNLAAGNKCLKNVGVKEDVDGCKISHGSHISSSSLTLSRDLRTSWWHGCAMKPRFSAIARLLSSGARTFMRHRVSKDGFPPCAAPKVLLVFIICFERVYTTVLKA